MFHRTMAFILTVTLITSTMPTRLLAESPTPATQAAGGAAETVRKVVGLGFIFGTLATFPAIAIAFRNPKIGLILTGITAATAVLSAVYLAITTKRDEPRAASNPPAPPVAARAPTSRPLESSARGPTDILDSDELRITE